MKTVRKSVLLWYGPHEIYALVADVEAYPTFLPWCARAEVLERHADGVTARLHLSYAGLQQAFTTRNTNVPDRSVHMKLVDGPFSELDGTWTFTPLPVPGADPTAPAQACRVDFELRYAFSSALLAAAISPVFDRIANTFVDAFVKRAEAVYGKR